jgi:hypothetical protein
MTLTNMLPPHAVAILISPVLRYCMYVYSKCSLQKTIENFDNPEMDEEIVRGLEGINKSCRSGWLKII